MIGNRPSFILPNIIWILSEKQEYWQIYFGLSKHQINICFRLDIYVKVSYT